jgi:hypothetical protein
MITTNGFPKSGNHALVKAVQLLGQPCEVNHVPFGSPVVEKHVFIKRDPRNVVCSWLRFIGRPVTDGMFLTSFRNFQGRALVSEMADYEGWFGDENTHVVRYEDLISDEACIRGIAEFLTVPYLKSAFSNLPGLTRTWNAAHSDYRAIWTPEVAAVWEAEGGDDLLKRWGY